MLPPGIPCDMLCPFFLLLRASVLPLQSVVGRIFQVLILLCVQFVPWVHDRCGPPPTNCWLNSMVLPAGFPPRPETPVFLCCRRISPPPWSPSPVAHSSEWAAEWLCVGCSRTVDLSHVPPSDSPPCPQCSNVPTTVVDVAASQHWFWCPRCQRRLEACVVEPPIPQGESVALPATPT